MYLSELGLGTADFNTLGFWNITSFAIETSGAFVIDNVVFENPPTPVIVPEPGTFVLFGGGLIGLVFAVCRRKKE